MKILVAIPVMGQFEIGRISLYQWDRTASPDCQFLIIDNTEGESPYRSLWHRGFISEPRWNWLNNSHNVGLIKSAQQAYEKALEWEADILVLTHNDVWVYPDLTGTYWDKELAECFTAVPLKDIGKLLGSDGKWGVIGLFGSKGCGAEGHRLDTFGSLIEMSGHGRQMTDWIEPAVCLDGFFLACSMKMLREAHYPVECPRCCGENTTGMLACVLCGGGGKVNQAGGFDQRYTMHHVYDYDIALTSIELGYRNAVLNIPCHHLSGLTANNDAYATSGPVVHEANYKRWLAKWSAKLGVVVDENWNYRWGIGK